MPYIKNNWHKCHTFISLPIAAGPTSQIQTLDTTKTVKSHGRLHPQCPRWHNLTMAVPLFWCVLQGYLIWLGFGSIVVIVVSEMWEIKLSFFRSLFLLLLTSVLYWRHRISWLDCWGDVYVGCLLVVLEVDCDICIYFYLAIINIIMYLES
jgi:hypothetical protein